MLLASASLCVVSVDAAGQSPRGNRAATQAPNPMRVPGPVLAPNVPAGQEPLGLILEPPVNSTLEIRTARRPWLLEKLTKPKTEPSVKMNPPRPPAEIFPDPPSMSRVPAASPGPGDGWQPRRADLHYGDFVGDLPSQPTGTTNESTAPDSAATHSPAPANSVETTPLRARSEPTTNVLRPTESTGQSVLPENQSPIVDPKPSNKDTIEGLNPPKMEAATSPAESAGAESTDVRELRIESDGTPIDDAAPRADLDDHPTTEPDQLSDHLRESRGPEVDEASPPTEQEVTEQGTTEQGTTEQGTTEQGTTEQGTTEPAQPEQPLSAQSEPPPPRIELDYTGYPRKPIRLTRTVKGMHNTMRNCLRYYYGRPEDANERSNWGVLHSIMVYGADTKIRTGQSTYNAIAWIAGNNACRGQKLLIEKDGYIEARSGVGLQGHQAQLLAILSLCDAPTNYPLYAGEGEFTVADLVETEMWTCRRGQELTFTLIGLAHYLDTDAAWHTETGEIWDFEKLIREELAQPIVGAACGGTHRLMAFAHALRKRRAEGKPITGQWKRAEVYTNDFISYAYRLQNRDGSMTTDWFEGREDNGDIDRKIQTTGHIVEWLLTVTPDSHLQDRRLVNAIRFLLKSMYEERGRDWKIGPKGHALRSLAMYYERVYQSGPAWRTGTVARQRSASRR